MVVHTNFFAAPSLRGNDYQMRLDTTIWIKTQNIGGNDWSANKIQKQKYNKALKSRGTEIYCDLYSGGGDTQ